MLKKNEVHIITLGEFLNVEIYILDYSILNLYFIFIS